MLAVRTHAHAHTRTHVHVQAVTLAARQPGSPVAIVSETLSKHFYLEQDGAITARVATPAHQLAK